MPETQGARAVPGVLASIVETKHRELAGLRTRRSEVERAAAAAAGPRDFLGALAQGETVSLIAECKRRSPGAGAIRPDLDPVALTRGYRDAGAGALSVLTDATYFGGSLTDLTAVRREVDVPVLRKDFTVDPLHLYEGRAAGADAVLLIVRILTDEELGTFLHLAHDLGMAALVETHDRDEVRRAVDVGARIIGINNRDLATFTTDLETTIRLLDGIPPDAVVISESGIRSRDDVVRLGAAGVDAILVGETLLRAADPTAAAAALVGVPRGARGA